MHQFLNIQGPQFVEQKEQPQRHGRVAHARYDEGLARSQAVLGFPVPEADQQVTADTHAFPSKEEEQQVGAQQQGAHGSDKQVHVGEEAAVTLVLTHIFR